MIKRLLDQTVWLRVLLYFIILLAVLMLAGPGDAALLLTCILFAAMIKYCLHHLDSSVYFFCFLISFFTFLLGGQVFHRLFKVYKYVFNNHIETHTNICLLLSICGLSGGFLLCEYWRKLFSAKPEKPKTGFIYYNSTRCLKIRRISYYCYLFLYCFYMFVLLHRVLFVLRHGYLSYYVSYNTKSVNVLIRYLGLMAPSAFYLYLATMPPKKEARLPIALYAVYLLATLGTGRRLYFMTGVLFLFAYFLGRNYSHMFEKPWISKKQMRLLIIMIPVVLIAMYMFEFIRSDFHDDAEYNPFIGFFVRQGTSVNVIKFAEQYKEGLDPTAKYSLMNIRKWIQDSPLNNLFQFHYDFGRQSINTALHGNNLADFVSSKVNVISYQNGTGWGSCYIAELYVDFGYCGVLIGNFLYGLILNLVMKYTHSHFNIWITACGLLVMNSLLTAPRAVFDAFAGQFLYFNNWGFILLAFLYLKTEIKFKKNE